MAGAGRRTFQPGEVLTASNVNSYLMDQSVMRFATSAARGSAIGTAVIAEGMVSYLTDSDALEFYDGAGWKRFAAGTGLPIANGGTGGTTVAEAQDNFGIGLANVVPSTVTYVTGSGSVNADGKVTFTGCSKVQIADVFSSNFTNYKIIILTDGNSINQSIQFRMMTGTSTEATASQYTLQGVNATSTNAPVSFTNSGTQWEIGNTWGRYSCDMTIHGPHLTIGTNINFQMLNLINTPAWRYVGASARHDGNLAYTGFSLFWPSGTTGGQVQVFGYNG